MDHMPNQRILYLSRADVEAAGLTMAQVIKALEEAFREKGEGRVEMPPKPGIHPGGSDNFIHAMPAYVPAMKAAGVKWVSGFPENRRLGLPYVSGLLILNNPETGLPISVMDCTWITAMRTAAASAVAAKYLARPGSAVLGILGCGVQGTTHAEALSVLFPLQQIRAYDLSPEVAHRYADGVRARLGVEVDVVEMPRQAVSGCDLVVTSGPILKVPHRTIQPGWMEEGAFASLVDFDSYWQPAAMHEATKFCTDDRAQLEYYQQIGYLQDIPPVYADLGELVTGRKPGRQADSERTLAANLGLAIGDMATAAIIYGQAVEKEIGTWLPI